MESSTTEAPVKKRMAHACNRKGKEQPSAIPWPEIQAVCESGVSMIAAAKQYASFHPSGDWQILLHSIKKMAQRKTWIIPATVIAKANERARAMGINVPQVSFPIERPPTDLARVETVVAKNASEIAESASLIGLDLLHGQLQEASANRERLAPLVDAKGIVTAIRGARMAAGLDKQGPAVSLSLWGGPMSPPGTSRDNVRDVSGSVLDEWEA